MDKNTMHWPVFVVSDMEGLSAVASSNRIANIVREKVKYFSFVFINE